VSNRRFQAVTVVNEVMRGRTAAELIHDLGVDHRSRPALIELKRRGDAVVPNVLTGLTDSIPLVRQRSCEFFDSFLVEDAFEGVVACLDDDDPGVRWAARHTLACERCKKDAWHPPAEAAELAAASWATETHRSPPR
jgi:hypothetical protein